MSDPGIIVPGGQGGLTVDGISLLKRAWSVTGPSGLSLLDDDPATRGGENRVLPGSPGRHSLPRRVDQTVYQLPFHVCGAIDPDDDPYDDPVMGLTLNMAFLREFVTSPPTPPATTRSAVRTLPDTTTTGAEVQAALVYGDLLGKYDRPAVLFLTVPAGSFA